MLLFFLIQWHIQEVQLEEHHKDMVLQQSLIVITITR